MSADLRSEKVSGEVFSKLRTESSELPSQLTQKPQNVGISDDEAGCHWPMCQSFASGELCHILDWRFAEENRGFSSREGFPAGVNRPGGDVDKCGGLAMSPEPREVSF
jgi:hypothetical protein